LKKENLQKKKKKKKKKRSGKRARNNLVTPRAEPACQARKLTMADVTKKRGKGNLGKKGTGKLPFGRKLAVRNHRRRATARRVNAVKSGDMRRFRKPGKYSERRQDSRRTQMGKVLNRKGNSRRRHPRKAE